jgi:hypothetical protein
MKTVLLSLAALVTITTNAQFKIPGKKDIEKRIEKEVKKDINEPAKEEPKTTPETKTPAPSDDEITGPAKSFISTFWKQIEKMRSHTNENNKQVVYSNGIQAATQALNNTKMKDANYNTQKMEQALEECKATYNGLASGKQDLRDFRSATLDKLSYFFNTASDKSLAYNYDSKETDEEKIERVRKNDEAIIKYKQEADMYANEKKDETYYNHQLTSILNIAKSYQAPDGKNKWPNGIQIPMHHYFDPESMHSLGSFTLVQEVKHKEAWFYAANKIYPNQPTIQKGLEWCQKAVAAIGSTNDVLASIKADAKAYLSKVKLPTAKVKDAALEAEFKKNFMAQGWGETVVKVNIQSTDWVIDRNSLTGIIVARSKQAYIASTKPDGTCWITEFWLGQDYNGSGYGNFRNITANSFRSQTNCDNIK